jgi:hypothetical protein
MPIQFKVIQDNNIIVDQYANKPTVYLDNWAFNTFALNEELGKKFTKIMNDKNGTIAFSIMNLFEITAKEDNEQIKSIVSFIDSIDGILIDVNPNDVIEREKDYRKRGITQSPCADVNLLRACFLYAHDPLKPFKISELILKLHDKIKTLNYELEQHFEQDLFSIILRARADVKALARARKRSYKKIECQFPPCTQQILSKCIDFIVLNQNMRMPDKEWCDVFHLITPVAYCDFVLADSRWTHFIRTLKLKKPCIAQVYSYNQIEKFLGDLKDYAQKHGDPGYSDALG